MDKLTRSVILRRSRRISFVCPCLTKKAKIMGKGKKKNGKSFWKKPSFITAVTLLVIGSVIELIFGVIRDRISPSKNDSIHQVSKGDQSPVIHAEPGSSVAVTYTEASSELLDRLERANIDRGKQAQIIEELKKKLKETEEALKERNVSKEALARFESGDYAEAEAVFEKELKEGAGKTANAAYYLGNINFARLKFEDALKYYQRAAELDPKNPLYLNEIGIAYYTLGKYQEAINHYEQALSIDREVYGERHPNVATSLNNLGEAWGALGKYEKAIEYYEQALSIDREVYGERHPDVARDLNNLGGAWNALGKYEKARKYLTMSYKMCVETLGENHPNTLQVKGSLDSLPR